MLTKPFSDIIRNLNIFRTINKEILMTRWDPKKLNCKNGNGLKTIPYTVILGLVNNELKEHEQES